MVYFFDLKIILKANKKVTKSIVERIRNKRKESYMSKLKGLWVPSNIITNWIFILFIIGGIDEFIRHKFNKKK